jgi:hypothetical protein
MTRSSPTARDGKSALGRARPDGQIHENMRQYAQINESKRNQTKVNLLSFAYVYFFES